MPAVFEKDVAFPVHAQFRFAIVEISGKHIDDFDARPGDEPSAWLACTHVLEAVDQPAEVKGSAVQSIPEEERLRQVLAWGVLPQLAVLFEYAKVIGARTIGVEGAGIVRWV